MEIVRESRRLTYGQKKEHERRALERVMYCRGQKEKFDVIFKDYPGSFPHLKAELECNLADAETALELVRTS